jgi:hypothetical protein
VIAHTRPFHIFDSKFLPDKFFKPSDGFEYRHAVRSTSAKIVDSGLARMLVKGKEGATYIVRVDVVPNLFALVSVDAVEASFLHSTSQIR